MFRGGDFDLNLVLRYDPLPKEVLKQAMLKQEHIFKNQVSTRLSVNNLQEHRVFFEQRLLVPQFRSNQHFNHDNRDNSVKENSSFCPQKPIKINHSFNGEVTPSEEVDLSLSIGWNKQRKEACKNKSWDHIIDLEDSNKTMSCEEVNKLDGSTSLLEQSYYSKGCCNVLISEDIPTNTKLCSSSDERPLLDLNRNPDELSFPQTDLGSVSSSTGPNTPVDNASSSQTAKSPFQNENDRTEQQPQYSSDTFELMVLKLPECHVDDSCVSSKPFEVDNMNNKDCGIAVRRGRRMKDFRRDVLPNLPSLSRHEISEDIRIMETVLRSREYKKMMSTMKSEQKLCTPVRSKRSRLNYVGKKRHS